MQMKDTNRRRRRTIAFAVTCFLLQAGVAPNVGLGSGRINFALVYAGVYALWVGGTAGVVNGFAAGLVFDLLTTGPIGLMAALLTGFSYVEGREERNRFSDGRVASMSAFGVGSLVVLVLYHLTMLLVGDASGLLDVLVLRMLPTYAITFLCFLPFAYAQVRETGKRGLGSGGRSSSLRSNHYDVRDL